MIGSYQFYTGEISSQHFLLRSKRHIRAVLIMKKVMRKLAKILFRFILISHQKCIEKKIYHLPKNGRKKFNLLFRIGYLYHYIVIYISTTSIMVFETQGVKFFVGERSMEASLRGAITLRFQP